MPDFAIRWCLMVAGMVLVLLPGTAAAQLHMCNETPELRSFAIGYKDGADWTSEGWWSVAPGECKTVRGQALRHAYFYYRATADGAFKGQGYKFCTSPDPFTIVGDSDCESRGYARDDFSQIEIGTASEFTFTLTAPTPAAASKDAQSNAAPIAPVASSQEPWGMVMYEPSLSPGSGISWAVIWGRPCRPGAGRGLVWPMAARSIWCRATMPISMLNTSWPCARPA